MIRPAELPIGALLEAWGDLPKHAVVLALFVPLVLGSALAAVGWTRTLMWPNLYGSHMGKNTNACGKWVDSG